MEHHVILCGLGQVGWRVLEYLTAANVPVVVVDNRSRHDNPRLGNATLIKGDCREKQILLDAGILHAQGILILTSDDLVNISTVLMVRHLHSEVRVVVRLFNQNLIPRLGKAVANTFALSVSGLTAPLLALTALTGNALGTFALEGGRRQITELNLTDSFLNGRTIARVTQEFNCQVLAHFSSSSAADPIAHRFLRDVDPEKRLNVGDRVVICGNTQDVLSLVEGSSDESLVSRQWVASVRRHGRIVWRTITEIDRPVRICALVLFTVVLTSTFIYHWGVHKSVTDGFYRTISVIATGADMHEEELKLAWQKIFVSSLRIAGAALTAVFTAIVTNYFLRARLAGVLELRRIPDAGHIVVCGLGNIGFRVVDELLNQGERVVVIEQNREGRFTSVARRRGVAVIFGDATVLEVLHQANAGTARAVVATTNDELVNLEIALLTREINPVQRTVVRISDPNLAQTLREAANIRFALSIPSLAAPAFVAAIFGDRIQSVFMMCGRLFTVVELIVQAEEQDLIGQPVERLASEFRFLSVNMLGADGICRQAPEMEILKIGDCLTLITSLPDLERLLRSRKWKIAPV